MSSIQRMGGVWVYLLLAGLLLAMYIAMAAIGFDLGLFGDVLGHIYRFETLGIRGGMNWLVTEHWERHLAGGLALAPVQVLFPENAPMWYAVSFAFHFLNALLFFTFLDDWLRGHYRPMTLLAALFFAIDPLAIVYHFEFATGTRFRALAFTFISLWAYLRYVRGNRDSLLLYNVSLFSFALGSAIYEQAIFFFLLHPIIAWAEDRGKPVQAPLWRYGWRLGVELVPFGLFVLAYVYLLDVLFISSNAETSVGYILRQFGAAFNLYFNPLVVFERLLEAWRGAWLLLGVGIAAPVAVFVWGWRARHRVERVPFTYLTLLVFSAGMAFLAVAAIAPTDFRIWGDARTLYGMSPGAVLLTLVLVDALLSRVPGKHITNGVYAVFAGVFIASGVMTFFQVQLHYRDREIARESVRQAVYAALPELHEDVLPYFILVTDRHPSDELWLYSQSWNFPFTFDLIYNTEGILADAVYYDIDLPPETSTQHIIATEQGILSPIRQGQYIDPARLVVIEYDSETETATVLEEVPPEVLAEGNFHEEVPFEWTTNPAYLE